DLQDLVGRNADRAPVLLEDDLPLLLDVARDDDRVAAVAQIDEKVAGRRRRTGGRRAGWRWRQPARRPRGRPKGRGGRTSVSLSAPQRPLLGRRRSGRRGRCPTDGSGGQDGERE